MSGIEDVQVEISGLLVELDTLAGLVEALCSSRQDLGRAGGGRRGGKPGSATAGNFPAIAVLAELMETLRDDAHRLSRTLVRAGVCRVSWREPAEPRPRDLLGWIREGVWMVPPGSVGAAARLREIARDLEHQVEACRVLVEGRRVVPIGDCPLCENPTLQVDLVSRQAFCGRHPHTKRFEPCVCSDPTCGCHRDPTTPRHTWGRDRWDALANHMQARRRATGASGVS